MQATKTMTDKPHLRTRKVDLGGLMRCCLETLGTTPVTEHEGDILPCKYCSSRMHVHNGIWKWDDTYETKSKE